MNNQIPNIRLSKLHMANYHLTYDDGVEIYNITDLTSEETRYVKLLTNVEPGEVQLWPDIRNLYLACRKLEHNHQCAFISNDDLKKMEPNYNGAGYNNNKKTLKELITSLPSIKECRKHLPKYNPITEVIETRMIAFYLKLFFESVRKAIKYLQNNPGYNYPQYNMIRSTMTPRDPRLIQWEFYHFKDYTYSEIIIIANLAEHFGCKYIADLTYKILAHLTCNYSSYPLSRLDNLITLEHLPRDNLFIPDMDN